MGNLLLFAVLCTIDGPAAHLADIGPAPAVRLTGEDGRPFDLADLRGRVVLVSFVFTTCTGTCPQTTANLARAQEVLKAGGLWDDRSAFVSISLDPERDTPEVLARYAKTYGADPARWRFLTGDPAAVAAALAAWDMWARRLPDGTLDHPSRIFLIDPAGHIREIYNLETLNLKTLVSDVQALRDEWAARR